MNIFICSLLLLTLGTGSFAFASELSSQSDQKTVVILLGPPGSGKGTQAVRIAQHLSIPHISTGDLFRENIVKDTALGKEAKNYIEGGQLAPDDLVMRMLYDRLNNNDTKNGFLLDGVPRTIAQAENLQNFLEDKNVKLFVINLNVPDAIIIERIAGRLKSQGQSQPRNDDKPEVVQQRLKVYHAQTAPLERFYSQQGILTTVDGTATPDEVYRSIISKFNKD